MRCLCRQGRRRRDSRQLQLRPIQARKSTNSTKSSSISSRLKAHDAQNRHYFRDTASFREAVNEARDMINEPGSVVTPEYLAEAARDIAKEVRSGSESLGREEASERRLQRTAAGRARQRLPSAADPSRLSSEKSESDIWHLSARASRSTPAASPSNPPTRCTK